MEPAELAVLQKLRAPGAHVPALELLDQPAEGVDALATRLERELLDARDQLGRLLRRRGEHAQEPLEVRIQHFVVREHQAPSEQRQLGDGARARWSSLRRDFGSWGLAAIAGASLAVVGAGVFQPRAARALYLSLAGFHVYLELVMLLYFWVAGGAERGARGGELACCR